MNKKSGKLLTRQMNKNKETISLESIRTWEEESGFIHFLSSINPEVKKFNETFEFGIETLAEPPSDIDGDFDKPVKTGFVLERRNPLLPEMKYCLYSVLEGRILLGYIGMYRNGHIQTLKELRPITNFREARPLLHEWLRQLLKASCEKLIL